VTEAPFAPGRSVERRISVNADLVRAFAQLSGDENPIHVDAGAAREFGFSRPVAHGAILLSVLSEIIGMELPGPGAIWMGQSNRWAKPVFVGDEIVLRVSVASFSPGTRVLKLDVTATNQSGDAVMNGESTVMVGKRVSVSEQPMSERSTRVALVTGGSGGIGGAAAQHLAKAGTRVAIQYFGGRSAAEDAVARIEGAGGEAIAVRADLADERAVAHLVGEVESRWGRLDIVVHAASPEIKAIDVEALSFDDVLPFLRMYVGGALSLVHAASAGMTERGFGRFIFLGTSYMADPPRGFAAYVTAKEALWGLVKSMAVELGPKGITSNLVSPSVTITRMTESMPQRVKEVEARKNPMRRLASTDDSGAAIAFLAGDAAGYINGVNLPVTGGG
jgi:3-oxoacyl-[acyl-carrier protein] reductase